MLKQKAKVIARIVYVVDLGLTTIAFFAAFFLRDLILPIVDPAHFPTGLFPISEYLKIYPIVLIIWSILWRGEESRWLSVSTWKARMRKYGTPSAKPPRYLSL